MQAGSGLRRRGLLFPGCGAHRHLHAHHITHWADGGSTDLSNLVLTCSFHHRYLHDHDLDVRLRAGTDHDFIFPDGRPIARARPLPDCQDPPAEPDVPDRLDPGLAPAPGLTGEADALRPVHWDGRYCLDTTVAVLQQQVHAVLPHAAGTLAA